MLRVLLLSVTLVLPTSVAAEDWIPSKWGADDTLGSVNEITPEIILNAAKLVKEGKRYGLGQITSRETPAAGSRTHALFVFSDGADGLGAPLGTNEFRYFDDWMLTHMGVGSQIDGLGHAAIGDKFYNGLTSKDFYHAQGLKKFGIEAIPPMVTRGVVLDMVGYMKEKGSSAVVTRGGVEMLKGGTALNKAELSGAAARQGVTFQTGDVILVHTGYMKMQELDPKASVQTWPGIGVEGAIYLAGFNPTAIGGDTIGAEAYPAENKDHFVPVHQELITKRGIYILENMVTAELVADKAWEFMFVLGQARFKGAVQMVINPVAIR
jgi:kynurenine formamidase